MKFLDDVNFNGTVKDNKTDSEYVTKAYLNGVDVDVELAAANWSDTTAPFEYTITNDQIHADSKITVSMKKGFSTADYQMVANASIQGGDVQAGSLTLKAYGTKPTGTINLTLNIVG